MRAVTRMFRFWPLAVALLALPAAAIDLDTRPIGPVHDWSAGDLARFDPAWLHVKFVEDSGVDLVDGRFVAADRSDLATVNAAIAGALTVRRTFPGDRETYREWKRRGEEASGRTGPDLSLWFDVQLPADRAGLASALDALNARPEVEIAHPAPVCEPAVIAAGVARAAADPALPTPDFAGLQGYLYDPPVGLDAPAAWALDGGRGAGMKFIDVELGWTLGHEDFDPRRRFYQGANLDPSSAAHGTAVLGEVIGVPNAYGVTGFSSDVQWGVVGITLGEWPVVPHYFLEAAEALDAGDVWLIELQMYPPGRDATPMEWLQVNFDVIWTSCWSLGVVCVEAGANGSQDLDSSVWGGVFDRDVRDSGAIMVAAGTPVGRVAEWFTNYGSRMDVHAWGSEIVTTGYGDLYNGGTEETLYTGDFGGTSGASPMVVGGALCLQGIATATLGSPLAPLALRTLLHDTGIPHAGTQFIGPRPDLGAAAAQLIDTTEAPLATEPGTLALLSAVSPFSGGTEVRFQQERAGTARLAVYDVAGRRVRTVEASSAAAGVRSLAWDGKLADGRDAGSGVYLYRLEAGGEVATGRLVKVR
ncbi:MAG TPA: FlgD immunoglobulin-like domain containing protein [Candidatus Krumholzibacteria bacterium]|nr:FlgD immunoglobulin-like domain containing protein [Candidatus Krumholzibacteria bacterium]HPD73043.1 FlgD immunoglobulin-like domain containing protein [Candidatus Krumholzibacteria bacterium]HRY41842.1 FlgD immunoglobulin-like domain containing protein [Candidatus Krumholzibacteria bacterium]